MKAMILKGTKITINNRSSPLSRRKVVPREGQDTEQPCLSIVSLRDLFKAYWIEDYCIITSISVCN